MLHGLKCRWWIYDTVIFDSIVDYFYGYLSTYILNFLPCVSHWNVYTLLLDDTYDKNKNRHWISEDYKKSRPRKYYRDMVSLWNKKVIVFDQIQLCSYPHKIHGKILFCIKIIFAPKAYVKKYDKSCRPVNRAGIAKIFTHSKTHFLFVLDENDMMLAEKNWKLNMKWINAYLSFFKLWNLYRFWALR